MCLQLITALCASHSICGVCTAAYSVGCAVPLWLVAIGQSVGCVMPLWVVANSGHCPTTINRMRT
jgi:hypothetical protein